MLKTYERKVAETPNSIRLTPSQKERLEAYCAKRNLPVRVVIRIAIDEYLERHDAPQK
jgi:hypothetical protein